ncbi:alkaline phosphatase synthesis sensor protein PhoR [Peptococcaceae bacterium CEB3]|nr:alkaline phosphatase synthesis sensor protein PhoR [Peptococcaceae bacterium CEB3]
MKGFNKISLRSRLTVLTALVLTAVCILLTLSLIFTYSSKMVKVPDNGLISQPNMLTTQISPREKNEVHSTLNKPSDLALLSLLYMLIAIVAGTVASYFIAGKALKPVSDLTESIENIDESKLFQPIIGFGTNDEVARLAASFNHMIMKLGKAFEHQKQFAANAAHELKTPLAGIIANIEVLQLDENPTVTEYKEVIDDTLENAQRLSSLVYDLLKMNSALDEEHFEIFDAKEMFDDIILSLSESSKAKNIRIENNISNIPLFGERTLLQRAFFNLVQNAVKYSKSNGKVVISANQTDDSVIINIRDAGIGIPENELDSIFEPFYRVDASRSRETGGSGLGLSIVKSVVEKHKGRIYVESEIGNFTKATVILPKN